jgi:CRISPR system Cascade subunit CasD
MENHLMINLEAPMMSFGGPSVDRYGPTERFPGISMLTGLLGNALGYLRTEHQSLQSLQDRISCAARIDQEPPGAMPMTDYQTAELGDGVDLFMERGQWVVGWTTRGGPEVRTGDRATYRATYREGRQRRWRDYLTDTKVTVALGLLEGTGPELDELAQALDQPSRPLFIGRKSCIPSERLMAGFATAESPLEALLRWPLDDNPGYLPPYVALQWEPHRNPGTPEGVEELITRTVNGQMNWKAGVHAGAHTVREGAVPRERLPRLEQE